MVGAMRVVSEPLDDVDGLAHVLGAIVELDDVDSASLIGGEDRTDGCVGVKLQALEVKGRGHVDNVDDTWAQRSQIGCSR